MEQWNEIRRRVLVEGVSRRQVQRETGMHWKTLKKVLEHSKPPGYRQERQRPKRKTRPLEERGREVSVLAGRARMPLVLSVERKLGLRARCQLHSNPHGQGFMAATSMNMAGKVTVPAARELVTLPSSRGWRMTSRVLRRNSGNSSRKSTP